jgi:CBS-domain-containing membrane protein
MDGHWLRRIRGAWRGLERHHLAEGAVAGLGGALAIGAMEWSSQVSQTPLGAIPFATSIVLVMGSPDAEPAQPRALVGGHILSTLVGIAVLALQLHFLLEVRSFCFGLVSASPERPCDDASGLDTSLRELEGDTTDFLD